MSKQAEVVAKVREVAARFGLDNRDGESIVAEFAAIWKGETDTATAAETRVFEVKVGLEVAGLPEDATADAVAAAVRFAIEYVDHDLGDVELVSLSVTGEEI